MNNTIGIDIEGDFDLWNPSKFCVINPKRVNRTLPRCWWDTRQVELTEHLVIGGHFSLALEDSDTHSSLVIGSSGVDLMTSLRSSRQLCYLALLSRNGRVSIDHSSEDSTQCLDTEREGSDIEQKNVFDITNQNTSLTSQRVRSCQQSHVST